MSLGRNGHLTELAIEQLALGEPVDGAAHLQDCELCQRAVANVRAHNPPIPPMRGASVEVEPPKAPRSVMIGVVLGLSAMLAMLLMFVWQPPAPDDGIRVKGANFDVTLYANDGDDVRPVADGDVVHPMERVGFRLANDSAGYLAIVGLDDGGNSYVCFPQDDESARFMDIGPDRTLEQAIRMDTKLGRERIVSVFCPEPFDVAELRDRLQERGGAGDELLFEGCGQTEVVLVKE